MTASPRTALVLFEFVITYLLKKTNVTSKGYNPVIEAACAILATSSTVEWRRLGVPVSTLSKVAHNLLHSDA